MASTTDKSLEYMHYLSSEKARSVEIDGVETSGETAQMSCSFFLQHARRLFRVYPTIFGRICSRCTRNFDYLASAFVGNSMQQQTTPIRAARLRTRVTEPPPRTAAASAAAAAAAAMMRPSTRITTITRRSRRLQRQLSAMELQRSNVRRADFFFHF